jgi:hypothetical protein
MGKKQSKKKKPRKKPGGGGAAAAAGSARGPIVYAFALAASAAAVFALQQVIGPGAIFKYAGALACGILTGFSGNPLIVETASMIAQRAGAPDAALAHLPNIFLGGWFSPALCYGVFTALMAALTFRDGFKKGWLRYEPALLVPVTALPGMALAWWANHSAKLFVEVSTGLFNSPYLVGFVAVGVLTLGIVKWATKNEAVARHWALSLVVGPAIGFWVGWLDHLWMQGLVVLLYFTYLFLTNESIMGTIVTLPIALTPIWFGKVFYSGGGDAGLMRNGTAGVPWALVSITFAGFAAAHLFAVRIMAALPAGVRRAIFFVFYILFFAALLFSL